MTLLPGLLSALAVTLQVWFGALVIGALVALLVVAGRFSRVRPVRLAAITWIELTRGVPTIVWLFCIFFGLSAVGFRQSAVAAAVVAMGLMSSGYIAEVYRAGFDSVDRGQIESAQALGVSGVRSLVSIIAPQTLPVITTSGGTYAIHLLKETALASLIGVPELMNIAGYNVERGELAGIVAFPAVGLIYVALCLPIVWLANRLRADLDRKVGAR